VLDRLGDERVCLVECGRRHHQRRLDVERGCRRIGEHAAAQHLRGDRVLQVGVALGRLAIANELDRLKAADRAHVADRVVAALELIEPVGRERL
jgi:hypothetical protein